MKSKFLVLGGSGFIGSYIVNELSKTSEVIATYSSYSNDEKLIQFNIQTDDISKIIDEYFKNIEKKTAVITIANSKIDDCLRNEASAYDINVVKMKEIILKLYKNDFKVIFLSTDNVYNGKDGQYTEDMAPNPINNYGKQKALIEQFIQDEIPHGLVLRLSQTVGTKPNESHIFKDWINSIKDAKDIICINGQKFTPTLVDDVALGVKLAIQKDLKGVYNLVANESFTREKLLNKFLKILDIKDKPSCYVKELDFFNFLEKRALDTSLVNDKIKKDLDIHFTSMDTILNQLKKEIGYIL